MGSFQGRALKLETACKVTFPLKCHVFLEKSFFHLENVFCHRAVSALPPADLLKRKLREKMENHILGLGKQIKQNKQTKKKRLGSTFPSGRFAAHPGFLTRLGPSALCSLSWSQIQVLPPASAQSAGGVKSLVHDLGRSRSHSQPSLGGRRIPVLQALVPL